MAPLEMGSSAESDARESDRADTLCALGALGSARNALKESWGVADVRLLASLLHSIQECVMASPGENLISSIACCFNGRSVTLLLWHALLEIHYARRHN